ncbi:MAG: hypothetical protein AB1558_14580 [Thermodesulfobacteriota bacterium]
MRVLHILRSEPDDMVRQLIRGVSAGETAREVPLYAGAVNYDDLIGEIFEAERVISWW